MEHSQSKDQYIRVVVKRLTKIEILHDELIEVTAQNKVLLAWNQELETQLDMESREKAGKYILNINSVIPEEYSGLILIFPCTSLHGIAHDTQC
jgi:hypothetical protein